MDNLKVGGVFSSRSNFTKARKDWSVGSFGDANMFIVTRNSGKTVEYKCKRCGTKNASPVNVRITVGRKKSNGGITAKGAPVTVTDWNPCDCRITKAGKTLSMPVLGQIFNERKDFKKHMHDYCTDNRKRIFERVEKGNRAVRKCVTDGCSGRVVVSFVLQKMPTGGHKWVPPLTVVEVQPCINGCEEMGGQEIECIFCSEKLPAWEFVRIIGECRCNPDYCYSCLMTYCHFRPLHEPRWKAGFKNKLVRVGSGPGEIQLVCPISKCSWSNDKYLYKGKSHPLVDLFPCGFDGDAPVITQVAYDAIWQQHCIDRANHVYESEDNEDDRDAVRDAVHGDLNEVEGDSPFVTNLMRTHILMHAMGCSQEEAKLYLVQHAFWEEETGDGTSIIEILE